MDKKIALFAVLWTAFAAAQMSCNPFASSHVAANVPDAKNFAEFLKRDLEAHFKKSLGREVAVSYEMLRLDATQSGVAYPKYYLWVRISGEGQLLGEGAARVAAIEKTHFEVTDFLSRTEIKKNRQIIKNVFPPELCDKIEREKI